MEIERRMERISEIKIEPLLISSDLPPPKHEQTQYYCRLKALDYVHSLGEYCIIDDSNVLDYLELT